MINSQYHPLFFYGTLRSQEVRHAVLSKLEWPETDSKFLNEDKIDYVVQINGKKRLILNENRNMDKGSLLDKIKTNKMSEKYLKDRKINKVIFIKNRLINLLLDE